MLSVSNPVVGLCILSAAGLFLAYAYTAPPFYWKYKGLGDICMVLGFGPLLVTGAYYCQLSTLPSLASLWFSLAPGLLTDGILHANNTRDQVWDKQCDKQSRHSADEAGQDNQWLLLRCVVCFLVCHDVCSGSLARHVLTPR